MITFLDEVLVCRECGREFLFSASQQEFFAVQGYQNEPQRCPACRERRRQRSRNAATETRIICAACGQIDTVPFRPKGDRPVYCKACYRKIRGGN